MFRLQRLIVGLAFLLALAGCSFPAPESDLDVGSLKEQGAFDVAWFIENGAIDQVPGGDESTREGVWESVFVGPDGESSGSVVSRTYELKGNTPTEIAADLNAIAANAGWVPRWSYCGRFVATFGFSHPEQEGVFLAGEMFLRQQFVELEVFGLFDEPEFVDRMESDTCLAGYDERYRSAIGYAERGETLPDVERLSSAEVLQRLPVTEAAEILGIPNLTVTVREDRRGEGEIRRDEYPEYWDGEERVLEFGIANVLHPDDGHPEEHGYGREDTFLVRKDEGNRKYRVGMGQNALEFWDYAGYEPEVIDRLAAALRE